MAQETLKNRLTNEAMSVNLGAFITPSGNGGSPTYMPKPYVEEHDDLSGIGRALTGGAKALRGAVDAKTKEQQDAALAQFDMDVYNIQTNPEMSASEKEIRVKDKYNQYPQLSVAQKHSVLSAHDADVSSTRMHMSEQQYKKDVVQVESDQRKQYSEIAVAMDPYNKTLSPEEQYKRGKQYMTDANALSGVIQAMAYNPDDAEFCQALGDKGVQYMRGLLPRSFLEDFVAGNVNEEYMQKFKESMAQKLQASANPVTGRTYSATEAYRFTSLVVDPMYKNMLEERKKAMESTKELRDLYDKDLVNKVMMQAGARQYLAYKLFPNNPELFAQYLGGDKEFEKLVQITDQYMKVDKMGRLEFPREVPNSALCMISKNANTPEGALDATRELFTRQGEAPQTPSTSINLVEMMNDSKGYFSRVPPELQESEYNKIKEAVAADIASNAQSLLINELPELPEDAPWYQKLFVGGYNKTVFLADRIGFIDIKSREKDLSAMLNTYTESLRGMDLTPQQTADIIKYSLDRMGVDSKKFKPLSDKEIPYYFQYALDALKSNILTRPLVQDVEKAVDVVSNYVNGNQEQTEAEQQVPNINIKETPEYNEFRNSVAKAVKNQQMTSTQASNEENQFLSKAKEALARVASEFGIKSAEAAVPPVPGRKPNFVSDAERQQSIEAIKNKYNSSDKRAEAIVNDTSKRYSNGRLAKAAIPLTLNMVGPNRARDILAYVLHDECRGETKEGQDAVASVMCNRIGTNRGEDILAVVTKAGQFSGLNKMSNKDLFNFVPKTKIDQRFYDIADQLINGTFVPTTDATSYYNPQHQSKASKGWTSQLTDTVKIGNHIFGKDKTIVKQS